MAPITTFVKCKTDATMEEKKYSTAFTSEDPINIMKKYRDITESSASCCKSRNGETLRGKWTKRRSKRRNSKCDNKDGERRSCLSKWSREKYESPLQPESEEKGRSR